MCASKRLIHDTLVRFARQPDLGNLTFLHNAGSFVKQMVSTRVAKVSPFL